MQKHTIDEILNTLQPDTLQLVCGSHKVDIDTREPGSAALVRAFRQFSYTMLSYDGTHVVLEYVGGRR